MNEQETCRASRSTRDGPWVWVSKLSLRLLTEAATEDGDHAPRARSVYMALCELASDQGKETFTARKALIAYRAGVSIRTVQRVLPELEQRQLLQVVRSSTGEASIYTLLGEPPGQNGHPQGHSVSPPRQNGEQGYLADMGKEIERTQKEESKKAPRRTPSLEEWLTECKTRHPDWPAPDAESAWNHYEGSSWHRGKTKITKWTACVSTCYRNWKERSSKNGTQRYDVPYKEV